jgi:hypothetical protein
MHRFEAELLHVKVRAHFGARIQQATVELIRPLVIRAHELGDLAFLLGTQPRATVAADVMECVDRTVRGSHHQNRILADLKGQEVAFGRHFTGHARDQPLFLKDFLHVDFKQPLIAVERLGQRVSALACLQHLGSRFARRFQRIAQAQSCGDVHLSSPQAAHCAVYECG